MHGLWDQDVQDWWRRGRKGQAEGKGRFEKEVKEKKVATFLASRLPLDTLFVFSAFKIKVMV